MLFPGREAEGEAEGEAADAAAEEDAAEAADAPRRAAAEKNPPRGDFFWRSEGVRRVAEEEGVRRVAEARLFCEEGRVDGAVAAGNDTSKGFASPRLTRDKLL